MKLPRRDVFQTHKPGETAALDVTGPACELLAFFFADKPVHAFVAKHGLRAVAQEYAAYREERIFKLLIEIATSYRLVSWRLPADKRAKEQENQVGLLCFDDDSEVPLCMHEACNKIIHAHEFALETRKIRRVPLAYIRDDTVLATGKKGRQEWVMYLWVPEFCEAALDMPLLDAIPFSGLTKRSSQPPPDDEIPF
jgi:hypothetical protein